MNKAHKAQVGLYVEGDPANLRGFQVQTPCVCYRSEDGSVKPIAEDGRTLALVEILYALERIGSALEGIWHDLPTYDGALQVEKVER